MTEASNFEPALQAQFPEIRAYSGKGITDRYATIKLSISPQGIQTMIFRTDKENEFIEPYSQDHSVYAVFKSQREKGKLPWTCSTDDHALVLDINNQIPSTNKSSTAQLKVMRLAQSCNGEYAAYFGASTAGNSTDQAKVLAAFNATLTRCNGVYEKDLALHLNLIANTTSVIFYNAATDPYSTTMSQWNSQLQTTLTNTIGAANHFLGTPCFSSRYSGMCRDKRVFETLYSYGRSHVTSINASPHIIIRRSKTRVIANVSTTYYPNLRKQSCRKKCADETECLGTLARCFGS